MKSIKTVVITLFSAVTLSAMSATFADNSTRVSSDGFLELTVKEVPVAATPAVSVTTTKADKVVKTTSVSTNRANRKTRASQVERKKRAAAKRMKSSRSYRVRSGDTLTKIAKKTGVSFSRLVRLNRLYGSKKNHIEVGQRLRLR